MLKIYLIFNERRAFYSIYTEENILGIRGEGALTFRVLATLEYRLPILTSQRDFYIYAIIILMYYLITLFRC